MNFRDLRELDERLLQLPYGEEREIASLIHRRAELLAELRHTPLDAGDAEELTALSLRTEQITARLSHSRRRLAEEMGDAARHRRFLDSLERSLPAPGSAGLDLDG